MKMIGNVLGAGAACDRSPTGAAVEASGPSYEGGFGIRSGNRGASAADPTGGMSTASTGMAERGGFTIGSGN